jgi:hypothetical protein
VTVPARAAALHLVDIAIRKFQASGAPLAAARLLVSSGLALLAVEDSVDAAEEHARQVCAALRRPAL